MARILIIEADRDRRSVLQGILEDHGHEVTVARDGLEGLKVADVCNPEVLVLDADLPSVAGVELAWVIHARALGLQEIPIVLVSKTRAPVQTARTVGTPYYLGVRSDFRRLIAIVDRALVERTAPEPVMRAG